MKTVIIAENIVECGCSNLIHKALASVNGVYGVKVSPEKKMISIDHTDETTDEKLINKLKEMGYDVKIAPCGNKEYLSTNY